MTKVTDSGEPWPHLNHTLACLEASTSIFFLPPLPCSISPPPGEDLKMQVCSGQFCPVV